MLLDVLVKLGRLLSSADLLDEFCERPWHLPFSWLYPQPHLVGYMNCDVRAELLPAQASPSLTSWIPRALF
jgi:hypothetical protein